MPPPLPQQVQLIRKFEPVLFFDPQERFFPSDAKLYLENCALWKPNAPFLERSGWGPPDPAGPVIPAGKIAIKSSEKRDATDIDLGSFLNSADCFVEIGRWKPPTPELPSNYRYADLNHVAGRYAAPTDQLNASRFWYHAEFFDSPRLRDLFSVVKASGGHDFSGLIGRNPSLLCYYLFFPGHDEGLSGCQGVPEALEYASFAGEWACIAILLEDPQANGDHSPKWVGLTNRNVGTVLHIGPEPEVRVGMRIFPWSSIPGSPSHPDHPLLMVARGSHALYRHNEALGVVAAFTPDDLRRNSCGKVETLPLVSSSGSSTPAFAPSSAETVVLKILNGMSAGGLIGLVGGPIGAIIGAAAGFVVGGLWGAVEAAVNSPPFSTTESPPPVPGPITDSVDTNTGPVVHPASVPPQDILPPNALSRAITWSIPTTEDSKTVGNRRYDFLVDREQQPLWPGDPHYPNCYTGRWGPNVENDPQFRRFGMRFPNFWRMFFDALVLTDSPAPATGGGNDANTKLLLHFDGQDGSVTFTDSSAPAHSVTVNGNAQIDTAQSRFGSTSGLFDGGGDYLAVLDHPDWDLPEGDFTIDGWFRWNLLPGSGNHQVLVAQNVADAANTWQFYLHNAAGTLELWFYHRAGGTTRGHFKAAIPVAAATWYHLAVEKLGPDVNFFQNGTKLITVVVTPWTTPAPLAGPLSVGNRTPAAASGLFNGWIDELRISKGVARFGGMNFTPRTAPYF